MKSFFFFFFGDESGDQGINREAKMGLWRNIDPANQKDDAEDHQLEKTLKLGRYAVKQAPQKSQSI